MSSRPIDVPLAVGQVRENPYNGQRCVVRSLDDREGHANVRWFGWPFSTGPQDVSFTTFVRMHENAPAGPTNKENR